MPSKLLASDLNRRVRIMRATLSTNTEGDKVTTFEPAAIVSASVRPSPGVERLQSAEAAASAPTIFRVRLSGATSGVSAKDRLEYPVGSDRQFNIVSVAEIGFRDGLEIVAVGRSDA